MQIIATIRDEDFGLGYVAEVPVKKRIAARTIIFDKDGNIALISVVKKHFHKLPGGGVNVDEGESVLDGLAREVSEEIGCGFENIRELAIVEEFRNKFLLHQLSYCFLADLAGEKGVPHLEQDEMNDGFRTAWVSLAEAIATVEKDAPVEEYEGKFIQKRDLALLKFAAQQLEK